jgi:hypothetical protein
MLSPFTSDTCLAQLRCSEQLAKLLAVFTLFKKENGVHKNNGSG